jgi:hypothetical protein
MNALILLMLSASPGQCANGNCQLPSSYIAPSKASVMHGWYESEEKPWLVRYHNGQRIGSLNPLTGDWCEQGKTTTTNLLKSFGIKEDPPKRMPVSVNKKRGCSCADACRCDVCPFDCAVALASNEPENEARFGEDPFPGGVAKDKVPQAVTYQHNGAPCSRSGVFQALTAAGSLTDDRSKMFLTIVGDESMRQGVLRSLETNPQLAALRGKLHVNAYGPTDWQVNQVGFPPGVTLQGPPDATGASPVLWRFRNAPDAVALAEAIRKADPNYRPDSDPDPLAKPAPKNPTPDDGKDKPTPAPLTIPVEKIKNLFYILLLVAGGGLVAYLAQKKKEG